MNKTKTNVSITDRGETIFTAKAHVTANAKRKSQVEWSLSASDMASLVDTLQEVKRKQAEEEAQQKAKQLEDQKNQFVDQMNELSGLQQLCYVGKKIVLPIIKRHFSQQPRSHQDEIQ